MQRAAASRKRFKPLIATKKLGVGMLFLILGRQTAGPSPVALVFITDCREPISINQDLVNCSINRHRAITATKISISQHTAKEMLRFF